MIDLSMKERVIARRLLRLMRREALPEEVNFVEIIAKRLGIELDPPDLTAEQKDEARYSNKRPGRTPGLRRSFAG